MTLLGDEEIEAKLAGLEGWEVTGWVTPWQRGGQRGPDR